MSSFDDYLRAAREDYARETADEATDQERARGGYDERHRAASADEERARREEETRRYVRAPWLDQFDRDFYAEFGRWPTESRFAGTTPRRDGPRRQAILNLIERGATEGERAAARAALQRLDHAAELDELHRLRPDLLEQEEDEDDFSAM